jgi:hypothetical protein
MLSSMGGGSASAAPEIFAHWQEVAGFERPYTFHALRHTAI